MEKTEKELQELKKKAEQPNKELEGLSEDELKQVSGGFEGLYRPDLTEKQNRYIPG